MKKERIRILLVEDNEDHVALIQRAFKSFDLPVQLIVAETLRAARVLVEKSPPILAIIDHDLPDGSGLAFLRENRGKSCFPCVLMTGHGDEGLAVESMKAGAFDYITKSKEAIDNLPHLCQRVLREWDEIARREQAEEALRASDERFFNIFHSSADAIFVLCIKTNQILEVNPSACRLLGYTRDELLRKKISEIHPDQEAHLKTFVQLILQNGSAWSDTLTARAKDGRNIPLEISASRIIFDGNRCILCLERDISERKRSEAKQRLSASILETVAEAIIVTDVHGKVVSVNAAFTKITGYSPEEVIGKDPGILESDRHQKTFYQEIWTKFQTSGRWQGEVWTRKKDGTVYPTLLSITSIKDEHDRITQYTGLFSDISQLKEDEMRLHYQAYYDALTSLPNRQLLQEHLVQAIKQQKRSRKKIALLFLDLDRFKQVNDTLGHHAGDHLLKMAAERLLKSIRETDMIARSGGDEFLLLLTGIEERKEAATISRKIIKTLSEPFKIAGHEVFLGASIGITIIPDDGDEPQKLFRNADMAMYKAKDAGRNKYHFFSDKMEQAVETHARLEWDLRRAVGEGEFQLYYQPVVDLRSLKTIAIEALIRWKHPHKRLLMTPGQFISVAEESDLIDQIGHWILSTACKCVKKWQDRYGFEGSIHVNVSTRQIIYGDFQKVLIDVLTESGLPPATLTLEVTESLMIDPVEDSIFKMKLLKAVGVQIAMDDFGTGYSSLSYLARYPIDILKIDQSFISNIASDKQKQLLVEAIIRMGQSMKMHIVAEGVERKEDLEYLCASGCDSAQGYYFSRPGSQAAYNAILEAQVEQGERMLQSEP